MKEVRETKLVEQTTVKWFSDDGKEFPTEFACRAYERMQKSDSIEKAYERIKISELEFPFQDWNGDCYVDLLKLKSYDDYKVVLDYLETTLNCEDIDCEEPDSYPCLKVLVFNEYYAHFAYEEDITKMLTECEKMMTIIEKAISEMN